MGIRVYDLDATIIDSRHRKCTLPDGRLDLDHWVTNCTAQLIALDSLLPLIHTMRKAYYEDSHIVVVCTARVLSSADYDFFLENDIPFHAMLDRPEGCTMQDADLKEVQLRIYAKDNLMTWQKFCAISIMYDDCKAVIDRMTGIGVDTIDANKQNRLLKWAKHA